MSAPHIPAAPPERSAFDPFRRAVLRGLGVLLPPLLTVVIFLWVGGTIARYVLTPLEDATRYVLAEYASDIKAADELRGADAPLGERVATDSGRTYRQTPDGLYIPERIYEHVESHLLKKDAAPTTAREYHERYVNDVWLRPWIVGPIFLSVFLLLLYALGKFLAAGIGRFFWNQFESLVTRVPLVSNVYSSVKQVTDFIFSDPDLDITRIVAVEYPRRGIWTVAFVTGESMLDIESAANEPVCTVLIPTSPMPFTGFLITVKKSETVDLNLTIDQAFQFIVSCGVVVPPQQMTRMIAQRDRGTPPPDTSAYGLGMGDPPLKGAGHPNGAVGSGAAELERQAAREPTNPSQADDDAN
ncbi:DUF502 domain-containing protein [Botrimarina sp.]|uniref:DUF502 domain-containing protein n=1 Tax=Botrimarina sp. TaxID=2795802 RepID=UPI0032EC99B3